MGLYSRYKFKRNDLAALFLSAIGYNRYSPHECACVYAIARVCGDPSLKKNQNIDSTWNEIFSRALDGAAAEPRALERQRSPPESHRLLVAVEGFSRSTETKKRRRRDEPVAFTMTKIELCRRERKARRTRPCTGIATARLWFPHYHSDFRGDGGSGERKREREGERDRLRDSPGSERLRW